MKRYIALLRGINISGKNKVPMAELRQGFEELGLTEVKSHLNSGNVIFSSGEPTIRRFMIILFLSCPLLPSQMSTGRLVNRKKGWNKYRNIRTLYSGPSAVRIIKKQTGGQRRQAPISAET